MQRIAINKNIQPIYISALYYHEFFLIKYSSSIKVRKTFLFATHLVIYYHLIVSYLRAPLIDYPLNAEDAFRLFSKLFLKFSVYINLI